MQKLYENKSVFVMNNYFLPQIDYHHKCAVKYCITLTNIGKWSIKCSRCTGKPTS